MAAEFSGNTCNVLEQVLDVFGDLEVGVLSRIVCPASEEKDGSGGKVAKGFAHRQKYHLHKPSTGRCRYGQVR